MGVWAVEPERMQQAWAIVRGIDLAALRAANKADPTPSQPLYTKRDGVGMVAVSGVMTKYPSSFQSLIGGASTIEARQGIHAANADPDVRRILLRIESPGGSVNGVSELYDTVANSLKPVHAHIEDIGASAALWVASAAKTVTANRAAMVGGIGAYAAVRDTSGAFEKEGIKVHVVGSGGVKGGGVEGAPVTDEYLAEVQAKVEANTDLFVSDVSRGRKLPKKQVQAMADGRLHLAAQAKELGLIDRIASFDEAFQFQARQAMDEQTLAAQAAELAELKAQNERYATEVKAARAQLEAVAHEKAVAAMASQLSALKGLPTAAALADVLVAIAPELQEKLLTQFRAWDAQSKTAALFSEVGSGAGGKAPVDPNDGAALRTAANEMVAQGKAKTPSEAMKQILREQANGGN